MNLAQIPRGVSWRELAACRRYDPEMWVLGDGEAELSYTNQAAVAVCHRCPVRRECHEDAQQTPPNRRTSVILAAIPYGAGGHPRQEGGRRPGPRQDGGRHHDPPAATSRPPSPRNSLALRGHTTVAARANLPRGKTNHDPESSHDPRSSHATVPIRPRPNRAPV